MKNNQSDPNPRQKHSSHVSSVFFRAILVSACLAILVTAVQLIVQSVSHSVEAASSQKGLISRDELWRFVDDGSISRKAQRATLPRSYKTLRLNKVAMRNLLSQAPMEFSEAATGETS